LTEIHVRNIYSTNVRLLGFISVMVPEVHDEIERFNVTVGL